jgi:hypothetical protein
LLLLASAAARCAARLAEKNDEKSSREIFLLFYLFDFYLAFSISNKNFFVSGELIAMKRASSSYRRKPWEFYWKKPNQITEIEFYFFFFSFWDVF